MPDPVKILVVGCGNMGKSHAKAYHSMEGYEIVGLVSRGEKSRKDLVEILGTDYPQFSNYEEALAELLSIGKIAGAGLDVFEREPSVSEVLLGAPNTVLLPHMGSATVEARIEMGEKVIINIQTLLNGHRPPDRIVL